MAIISNSSCFINQYLIALANLIIKYVKNNNLNLISEIINNYHQIKSDYSCSDHENEFIIDNQLQSNNNYLRINLATNDFIQKISLLSDYVGCNCHNQIETNNEFKFNLDQYLKEIIPLILTLRIENNPVFNLDLNTNLEQLFKNQIDLKTALQNIKFWQNAVDQHLLQQALLIINYSYIQKINR